MMVFPFRPSRRKVLCALNDARSALDMNSLDSIPSGIRGKLYSCPVSRSLSRMVGVDGVCFKDPSKAASVARAWQSEIREVNDNIVVSLPEVLRRFVRDFDLGAYPTLLVEDSSAKESPISVPTGFQPTVVQSEKPAA